MKIKSFELNNFRKFRSPVRLDGFTDGLNIVIEPNETGKSTLLDAMRATLFERHTSKNELTKSYCPWDDEVAPSVSMCFGLEACEWQIDKQFLKGAFARLSGGGSRFEGEAAEERLQSLLGFERGGNRGSDLDSRGALGLLWVEQCGGLDLAGPGRVARDTIRGVLESEVGAVTGGKRFTAVSASVDAALGELRTNTGKSRGKLAAAEVALEASVARRKAAEATFREYEDTLSKLERANADLRRLESDINDPEREVVRKKTIADLETAQRAQQRLRTLEAQRDGAIATRKMLQAASAARRDAALEAQAATEEITKVRAAIDVHTGVLASAVAAELAARSVLLDCQNATAELEATAKQARLKLDAQRQAGAHRRAFERLDDAVAVETQLAALSKSPVEGLDAKTVARLAELETERARCQAILDAGAVHLEFVALPGAEGRIVIAGKPISGRVDVSRPTDVVIAEVGTLRVTPPASLAVSAEVAFATADQTFLAELRKLGVASVAEARLKLDQQRADTASIAMLRQRLVDICVADEALGIAAGIDALRAALLGVPRAEQGLPDSSTDTTGDIEARLNDRRAAEVKAGAGHKVAAAAVQQAEVREAGLASQEAAATLRLSRAQSTLVALNEDVGEGAAEKLQGAIELEARLTGELEAAVQNAAAFDVETLERRLAAACQRARNETAERIRLSNLVGGLEATVKAEGGKGPAGLLEEAMDEEAAASISHARLCREADTLSMLSRILRDTASAAARQFVEPVTRRAAFYIQRLLPGSNVGLSQEMAVDGLVRQGRSEVGHALSRGTQEQLAILTRLAFADLLLDKQRPVSIVLDDALVYSDDDRLEVMTDILAEAAKRMQIILLTCRAKAFRHVEATRLSLA